LLGRVAQGADRDQLRRQAETGNGDYGQLNHCWFR
jgi:hypothetical protein